MADYYTLLTNAGIAHETACKASGTPIKLTHMSVGDGGGSAYNPDATAVALRREVWRGSINALMQDQKNLSWLLAEVTIPNEVGGWYVREAAIWTDTGILYAVIKYPESFKPVMADQGAGKEFYLRAIFQTSNASNVVLSIDDSIVKATRAWVADYVAGELAKLDTKKSVRAAATGPIVLSGAQMLDGVAVVAGDSVLVTFQAIAATNGIYTVANGTWFRRTDADVSGEVTPNLIVSVEEGTKYADTLWQLTTNAPIILGTTALEFEQIYGPSGVIPGTYRSVSVDRRGFVIGGTNPTSLAGFGIVDAFTKTESDVRFQSKLTYLPVQQGTGIGQLQNTVRLGWSGNNLKLTIDNSDLGKIWTSSDFSPDTKANWGSTLAAYGVTNAFTKDETNYLVGQRALRDGVTNIGMASNDPSLMYMRRETDNLVYFIQKKLDYTPVSQGTGVGQNNSRVNIGWSSVGLKVTVDTTDLGNFWYSGNFSPDAKANWGSTLAAYGIINAYTKDETGYLVAQRVMRDGITNIGMAGNDPALMYMRRESDNALYFIQRKLDYTPVAQGTGVGQTGSRVNIGWSPVGLKATVDTTDLGNFWYSGNFSPDTKANWGSTLAAYGITNAYTKDETIAKCEEYVLSRPIRDAITTVGMASDNPEFMYMRRLTDGVVYYIQPRLGYTPIQQGGGVGQVNNKVKLGFNSAGSLRLTVDATDFGDLISDANHGAKVAALGLSAVGQYAFARSIISLTTNNQNTVLPGSQLIYTSTTVSDGAGNNSGLIAVGQWRLHGAVNGFNASLWQRVS